MLVYDINMFKWYLQLSIDIGTEVKYQNKMLDDMVSSLTLDRCTESTYSEQYNVHRMYMCMCEDVVEGCIQKDTLVVKYTQMKIISAI